ncbi:MAG: hypothetical protein ACP5N2_02515 [Candidatus Nanoarchaeia archaeon]
MIKIIDSLNLLNDKPRPHYLIGNAEYEELNGVYKLKAKVLFNSENPSVADRLNLEIPHVNIGDAYFALWNSIHLISEENGWKNLLAVKGTYNAKDLLTNVELDLETLISSVKTLHGKLFADYKGTFSLNEKKLLIFEGVGCGYAK